MRNINYRPLMDLTLTSKLRIRCYLFLLFPILYLFFLTNYLRLGNREFRKQIKLKKRFIKGGVLGFFLSLYITDRFEKFVLFKSIYNAIIYGHWGITIIALDTIQDSTEINSEEITKVVDNCFSRISGTSISSADDFSIGFTSLNILYSKQLCTKLGYFISKKKPGQVKDFLKKTRQLLNGQLYSNNQKIYNANHDFEWYMGFVVNDKTLNFFHAPISLFTNGKETIDRCNKLNKAFLALNDCYFHWQIIDDVADLEKDTFDSIITTPGYILISQANAAEFIEIELKKKSTYKTIFLLLKKEKRFLLRILNITYPDTTSEGNALYALKSILGNNAKEINLDFGSLIKHKILLRDSFQYAFKNGRSESVIKHIIDSEVLNRILNSCLTKEKIQTFHKVIQNDAQNLQVTLFFLNTLMKKCFQKGNEFSKQSFN